MGQSLVKNYLHIVFSTKHRQSLISPAIEPELYSYLAGILNNLECSVMCCGTNYTTLSGLNMMPVLYAGFHPVFRCSALSGLNGMIRNLSSLGLS